MTNNFPQTYLDQMMHDDSSSSLGHDSPSASLLSLPPEEDYANQNSLSAMTPARTPPLSPSSHQSAKPLNTYGSRSPAPISTPVNQNIDEAIVQQKVTLYDNQLAVLGSASSIENFAPRFPTIFIDDMPPS